MIIIEDTMINGKQSRISVTNVDTTAEAINAIQALAILAVGEIACQPLKVMQSYKVIITEKCARISYPNGDTLKYYINQKEDKNVR